MRACTYRTVLHCRIIPHSDSHMLFLIKWLWAHVTAKGPASHLAGFVLCRKWMLYIGQAAGLLTGGSMKVHLGFGHGHMIKIALYLSILVNRIDEIMQYDPSPESPLYLVYFYEIETKRALIVFSATYAQRAR
ncbi:unnamed protein product [Protopolystoma xenopodis]|uniref:Uncharacterized protein n=1 Tax=Protopolystoma xenopodis TaxID=117903 RepID=A0A448WLX1_9PLAT|nr:unnamed protein product [Protopolystoma xenopodis]